ncbi:MULTISPECIES: helix-turn-helix transcriptional regulator [unclassified Spirosoma]|uniref:helix-turn-helix transcriptional regulator n=1 Tax=unclassified Spirosoma TaxID=2621999 RepID=UPI00096732A0|nr:MULTISPECIES: helix-turn-helix transcriptional regulator [unclassified Spirosoma]MBN8824984.1 helix-turn-helix transcriptional regulator [Spirosoma sp.]OJW73279.1 MAG: AraC family transcriptional regulator [Spirosoma sp. 48-14]
MRFDKIPPVDSLKPYIKHFVISESTEETTYKIFPSTSLVIGFQYQGQLASITKGQTNQLSTAGITGLSDHVKVFKNSADIGTILVFFTEVGLAFFTSCPANELFNQSISLDTLFSKQTINETEEKLALAQTDSERIRVVERFLLSQLKVIQRDKLVIEAVRLIYESKGTIRISELNRKLATSQSPLEKRFRKLVGTTPKKFASIVRFNTVFNDLTTSSKSLTEICYEHNFFDQSHFIKTFKRYTGETPEHIKWAE